MKIQGTLLKMNTEKNDPVDYFLNFNKEKVHLNTYLGKQIKISYLGEIHCIKCGRKTSKSFQQGYCYPCFMTAPETSECILKPELCRAHEGISRDMQWSEEHCLQNHFVYLAFTSGIKVGVTRESQIPTRWIDQGAILAVKIAQTPNRFIAGLIEIDLKKYFDDKTNWRSMLSNKIAAKHELEEKKTEAFKLVKADLKNYFLQNEEVVEINFPVIEYPAKVTSIDLENTPIIESKLTGIKGQYLLFDNNTVINIRKHNGYLIQFEG